MESKKKRFSYKDILYKSRRMTALALLVMFGAGIAVVSGGQSEIPVHDGDVLVDSLAIEEEAVKEKTGSGSFEERRAALELERNKLIAALDDTIDSTKNDDERARASSEKERIMTWMETELAVENMIVSKNLPKSFVLITDQSVTVTVDKQELDTSTVAKICDIAMRETGRTADKIIVQSAY